MDRTTGQGPGERGTGRISQINERENLMKLINTLTLGALVTAGLFVIAGTPCYAEKTWAQEHARRAQVDKRLNNQDDRIDQGVSKGTLTQGQGTQLKKENEMIRQEGKSMASVNGQITKTEQSELNQEANAVSKQIDQEKKDNKKK